MLVLDVPNKNGKNSHSFVPVGNFGFHYADNLCQSYLKFRELFVAEAVNSLFKIYILFS